MCLSYLSTVLRGPKIEDDSVFSGVHYLAHVMAGVLQATSGLSSSPAFDVVL